MRPVQEKEKPKPIKSADPTLVREVNSQTAAMMKDEQDPELQRNYQIASQLLKDAERRGLLSENLARGGQVADFNKARRLHEEWVVDTGRSLSWHSQEKISPYEPTLTPSAKTSLQSVLDHQVRVEQMGVGNCIDLAVQAFGHAFRKMTRGAFSLTSLDIQSYRDERASGHQSHFVTFIGDPPKRFVTDSWYGIVYPESAIPNIIRRAAALEAQYSDKEKKLYSPYTYHQELDPFFKMTVGENSVCSFSSVKENIAFTKPKKVDALPIATCLGVETPALPDHSSAVYASSRYGLTTPPESAAGAERERAYIDDLRERQASVSGKAPSYELSEREKEVAAQRHASLSSALDALGGFGAGAGAASPPPFRLNAHRPPGQASNSSTSAGFDALFSLQQAPKQPAREPAPQHARHGAPLQEAPMRRQSGYARWQEERNGHGASRKAHERRRSRSRSPGQQDSRSSRWDKEDREDSRPSRWGMEAREGRRPRRRRWDVQDSAEKRLEDVVSRRRDRSKSPGRR